MSVANDLYHLPLLAYTVRLLAGSLPAWTASVSYTHLTLPTKA